MGTQRRSYDPTTVYDPTQKPQRRPQKSPSKPAPLPTRFPDEDHAYHALRRVQVTKLQQNALPPPSPSPVFVSAPTPRGRAAQKRQRIANLTDSALWGFPVRYSPTKELADEWHQAIRRETREVERRQAEQLASEQRQRREQDAREQARQDYALYLYLASKYGALDGILYCCTSFPGRLYALLIDQSVRKLQKWRHERVVALRKYWIVTLARDVVDDSFSRGLGLIEQALAHQQRAAVFLKRLRWRFAASAFHAWYEFTQRQAEVRWRFQFATQEDLRSRFVRWRQRIAEVKEFKRQLKQVARRKQMQSALSLWQQWQARQQKLRIHLQQQWTRIQRGCLAAWREFALRSKRERHACIRIQSRWRGFRVRKACRKREIAARKITNMVRGRLARRRVVELRQEMGAIEATERILRAIEWEAVSDALQHAREVGVRHEMARTAREAEVVAEAEQRAVAFVKSELSKVRKNDYHHRLQQKLRALQDGEPPVLPASGARTMDVWTPLATDLVLRETAHNARQLARTEFVECVDQDGHSCNLPEVDEGQCVACTASARELSRHSLQWPVPVGSSLDRSCPHVSAVSVSTDLHHIYADILAEAAALDASFHAGLLLNTIAVPTLWRLRS